MSTSAPFVFHLQFVETSTQFQDLFKDEKKVTFAKMDRKSTAKESIISFLTSAAGLKNLLPSANVNFSALTMIGVGAIIRNAEGIRTNPNDVAELLWFPKRSSVVFAFSPNRYDSHPATLGICSIEALAEHLKRQNYA
mmetsp:Transcript_12712/g.23057  ORF Transcript_12712/g.23057 Transcript_12712/m.23057 type:complete len:138 (+) Transcript_12712:151-564(+)|eukprot:CAMPEP_0197530522 /NCGR_PEP_ID=MMETSP1318-20131121/32116_1 /TAXON_ID=552666 /ORGANISM="Partenskyella glossopodia, Strain RCC365" /LENGTH=137 /DNA_ID=CAMNT_0043086405 /DNA_START=146 /DNA_END=559 /DNA_ORIENTATION=+